MNDKYYTPELSEFHVGLKYEVQMMDGNWVLFEYMAHSCLYDIMNPDGGWTIAARLNCNMVRVKHLDEGDIIDCGWLKSAAYGYYWPQPVSIGEMKVNLTLCLNVLGRYDIETDVDLYEGIDFLIQNIEIKNINELQFLMKRLNITT